MSVQAGINSIVTNLSAIKAFRSKNIYNTEKYRSKLKLALDNSKNETLIKKTMQKNFATKFKQIEEIKREKQKRADGMAKLAAKVYEGKLKFNARLWEEENKDE